MPKKMKKIGTAEVHNDLEGFDIQINTFGETISSVPMEKINKFLNKNAEDKKLTDYPKMSDQSEEE